MLRWRVLLVVTVLLVVLLQPALTRDHRGDRVVLGRSHLLGPGDRVEGDLIVFGGDAVLEPNSSVGGDVVSLGGSVDVAGQVDGRVIAPGGRVRLGPAAVVTGDVLAAGQVWREPGTVVGGRVLADSRRGLSLPLIHLWGGRWLIWLPGLWFGWPWALGLADNPFVWALQVLLGGLLVVGVGILLVLLAPSRTMRVASALAAGPLQSLGAGILAGLVGVVAVPFLAFTCVGIPLAIAAALAFGGALALGWVAAGLAVGERLLRRLQPRWRPPWAAAAAGLALLAALLGVPYLQGPVIIFTSLLGLGAVSLTRFGSASFWASPPQVGKEQTNR